MEPVRPLAISRHFKVLTEQCSDRCARRLASGDPRAVQIPVCCRSEALQAERPRFGERALGAGTARAAKTETAEGGKKSKRLQMKAPGAPKRC